MLQLVEWLALVTTLPSRNTAARMRLWRAVKALGAAVLRDGVYLLPAREATGEALRTLAEDVRAAAGSAEVLHVAADAAQDEAFRRLFERDIEFTALIAATHEAADEKALRRLTRELSQLSPSTISPALSRNKRGRRWPTSPRAWPRANRTPRQAKSAVSPAPTFRDGPGRRAGSSGSIAWHQAG